MSFIPAIDVSQYQGQISWAGIGEPIAILKISGGDAGLYYDQQATKNYYGAKNAGKAVGCYHFAGGDDPIAEAGYFLRGMEPLEENDVMVLDWEISHPNPVAWCQTFMQHVHDKSGVWPLIYMNLSTLNSFDWSPVLTNCGLWLADWNNSPDGAAVTSHVYVMQQYNDSPWCDHDAWFGTVDEFKKYGWHAPVTPPTPPAPQPPQGVPNEPTAQPTQSTPATPPTPSQPTATPSVPETRPAPQSPAPTIPTQKTPTEVAPAPQKVIVPEPTYYRLWELIIAIFKKLLGRT